MALSVPPAQQVDAPYERTTNPSLVLAHTAGARRSPPDDLIGGGWDSTMVENHLGMGEGDHRSLANRKVLDRLDEVLEANGE